MKEADQETITTKPPRNRRRVAAVIGGAVCAGLALGSQYLLLQPEFNYVASPDPSVETPVNHSGEGLAAIEGFALGGIFLAAVIAADRPEPPK